jgi:integrase
MARAKRKNKSQVKTDIHPILDGISYIYKMKASGEVWQFLMYIQTDKRNYRCSLKTRDYESATAKAIDKSLELSSMVRQEIKVFGMTLQELVNEWLEYRYDEVTNGDIVKGRWDAIRSQLKNLINHKGGDTKLSELHRDSLFEYATERRLENQTVTKTTLRNEQSTINAMFKYAYRKNHINFPELNFKKIVIRPNEVGKRDTFTLEEYDKLIRYMRQYVSKKHCPDDDERHERLIIRDYILCATNSCLRRGEIMQLTWDDVQGFEERTDANGQVITIVKLRIRAETSKVRQERIIFPRGGEYFKRLHRTSEFIEPHHLLFTFNGHETVVVR